jgi:integrase
MDKAKDKADEPKHSVTLKRGRDGKFRPNWYGDFQVDGVRKVMNLGVKWRGTPPASGSLRHEGDTAFEKSRTRAEAKLDVHVKDAHQKGHVQHLTERLIESKTGSAVEYTRIIDLAGRWRALGRGAPASEAHLVNCDAHFDRFVKFMRGRKPDAVYLYEVTAADAAAFVEEIRGKFAPATAQYGVRLLAKALGRFLPVGSANAFGEFIGMRKTGEGGVIHRQPFTPEELRKLLDAARDDEFLYPLVVTAMCSGMRRSDVCNLRWADVDLAGGMLTVKTSKTDANVEIPIFGPLRAVLQDRPKKGKHVFTDAVAMAAHNSQGVTYRFKALVARALDTKERTVPAIVPAASIEAEGAAAIAGHIPEGERRDRMLDTFRRYAAGASIRTIAKETGRPKGTISGDLHLISDWTGKRFVRSSEGPSIKTRIARVTRAPRAIGKAASVRDWHALRTTFVTLALSAGVPMELVRRVTGHATVEVVLKHYFRPDREQFKAALINAMPDILTETATPKLLSPADELTAMAGKVAAGTATDDDKKRLRKLVAKI